MAKKVSRIDVSEQDIFGSIGESAIKAEAKIVVLKTAIEQANEQIAQTKKEAQKLKGDWMGIDATTKRARDFNKVTDETTKVVNANTRAVQNKAKFTKALTIEEAKLKEAVRLANVESRQVARLKLAEEGSVKKLQAKLAILTREWDKLSEAERRNTDRGKRLKAGIDATTVSVSKLEQATGRHQRNVGNYGTALDGLKGKYRSLIGFASQLGLAMGGALITRNAINTIVQFDSAVADLSAITGASGKDLDFFRQNAIKMGVDVKGGASAVVEAYKLIASAKPELLENAEALNNVTEAAILLSRASGMELPAAATALTDAMNQFGVGADQAGKFVDVLAAGAKFGSAEIPQITEALLKFGAVAKTANVNIQESTGLIEALAERGLKGAEAGTALRNVMLKLSAPDALPKEAQERLKALGVNFEALSDKSKPFSERLEALKPLLNDNAALIKVFGTENAVAATTLLNSTDRIKELTASVNENGVALEQANVRSKTISEAFNRLVETVNGLILGFANGSEAASGFVSTLDFLRENLSTILSVMGQLLKIFLIYKARMIAINIATKAFGDGTGKMNVSLKQLGHNLTSAGGGLKAFGSAAKGVGWAALIALAYEFGKEVWDIASGANRARYEFDQLQKAMEQGSSVGGKLSAQYQKQLNSELDLIDKQLALGKITEKQAMNARLAENKRHKQRIFDKIKELRLQRDELALVRDKAKAEVDAYKASLIGGTPQNLEQAEQLAKLQTNYLLTGKTVKAYNGIIVQLRNEYKGIGEAVNTLEFEQTSLTKSTEKSTKAIKEKTKALKGLTEQQKEYLRALDVQREIETGAQEFAISDAESNTQDVIDAQLELAEKGEAVDIDLINRKIEREEQLKRDLIESEYQYALLYAKSQEDIELATQKRNYALIELDDEYAGRKEDVLQQINDTQETYAEKQIETAEETAKKTFEAEKKWLDLAEELWTSNIDKKIALLEKEVEAHQKASDELKRLAEEGNITASQSIAEENRLMAEAQAEQERLEQRKRQIQLIAAFVQSYLNSLEGGASTSEALATASMDKGVVEAFIASMPAFLDGTEDTGKVSNALDEHGGRLAVLHDNERVMTKEQNQALNGLSNDEVVRRIQESNIQKMAGNIAPSGWDNLALLSSVNDLKSEMKNVKKAIEDKPVVDWNMDQITSGVMQLTKKITKGNSVHYNRYRVE